MKPTKKYDVIIHESDYQYGDTQYYNQDTQYYNQEVAHYNPDLGDEPREVHIQEDLNRSSSIPVEDEASDGEDATDEDQ